MLNLIKGINEKPIATIEFNGEKLNAFPPESERREACPFYHL